MVRLLIPNQNNIERPQLDVRVSIPTPKHFGQLGCTARDSQTLDLMAIDLEGHTYCILWNSFVLIVIISSYRKFILMLTVNSLRDMEYGKLYHLSFIVHKAREWELTKEYSSPRVFVTHNQFVPIFYSNIHLFIHEIIIILIPLYELRTNYIVLCCLAGRFVVFSAEWI